MSTTQLSPPPVGPVDAGQKPRVASRLSTIVRSQNTVLTPVLIVLAVLALAPIWYLFRGTFIENGRFTLDGFHRAYASPGAGRMTLNSLGFALGSTVLATAIGAGLAFIQQRTDAGLKHLLFLVGLVPLVIPGLLYTTAWIFLASPHIGLINSVFHGPFGIRPFNIYSMWGMIWVQGLHMSPIPFLAVAGAMRGMDTSLEESALTSGATWRKVLRRITFPLLRPAIAASALLVFVKSLESFEVPGLIGLQRGIFVFTSRIYFVLQDFPIDYGAAGALAFGLLVIALVGLAWSRGRKGAESRATITGKAFRPRRIPLGKARPLVTAAVGLYAVIAVVLPILILIYSSFLPYYQVPSKNALRQMSLENYRQILNSDDATAFKNSAILAIATPFIVMAITGIASWFVVRTNTRGRGLVSGLTFIPIVVPGLVLGLAVSFIALRSPLPIYGTLWIILLALCIHYIPFGMRYAEASMGQPSKELEEAAMVSGATWHRTMRRIIFPLTSSGLLAGFLFIFIMAFRELSAAILLYSPGNETVGIVMWQRAQRGQFGELSAIGTVLMVFLGLVAVFYKRLEDRLGLGSNE